MNKPVFLSEHFINREMSWLEFNARVLEEAQDPTNPLLERVKFLSIFSSNLDEYFMVRVAGLREQAFGDSAPQDYSPDALRPLTQLQQIAQRTQQLVAQQYQCLNEEIFPQLVENGIRILKYEDLKKKQLQQVQQFFQDMAFPILTPMAVDPSHPSPRYHNRGLYLAVMLRRRSGLGPKNLFAVVQIPTVLPRLFQLDNEPTPSFVLLEEIVSAHLPGLFGGFDVESQTTFRITRDSDMELLEQESDDMLRLIEERIKARQRGDAVRLEVAADASDELVQWIVHQESLHDEDSAQADSYNEVYKIDGPLDLTGLLALVRLNGFENLRDHSFTPRTPRGLRRRGEDLFTAIARHDIMLHHPYDAFDPVVEFVTRAAEDPNVLAIKQTLYRTSGDSPIIRALIKAAESGKHVTALVELKARFDEEANVSWARQMERSGVHVVFGFLDLKTHCKVSLVIRQEGESVQRYVHLGTGNYNPTTALLYTDMGLFTADELIGNDASALFNLLTGYSQGHQWSKLVVAPDDLHRRTIELIEEQTALAKNGEPAKIFAKLNSLVDHRVIDALYCASQAGVQIDLVVRGICCLRPGIAGVSENIHVRSIVDRFLEHSRICVFGPEDDCNIYLSSADWMPRNFYRRVEIMFPVQSSTLRKRILTEIIPACLKDNVKARVLNSDGSYTRLKPKKDEPAYRCQEELLAVHSTVAAPKSRITIQEIVSTKIDDPDEVEEEKSHNEKGKASG